MDRYRSKTTHVRRQRAACMTSPAFWPRASFAVPLNCSGLMLSARDVHSRRRPRVTKDLRLAAAARYLSSAAALKPYFTLNSGTKKQKSRGAGSARLLAAVRPHRTPGQHRRNIVHAHNGSLVADGRLAFAARARGVGAGGRDRVLQTAQRLNTKNGRHVEDQHGQHKPSPAEAVLH